MNGNTRGSAAQATQPTSPWNEAHTAAPQPHMDACMDAPASYECDESQQPTHDALSDIYNRQV